MVSNFLCQMKLYGCKLFAPLMVQWNDIFDKFLGEKLSTTGDQC